MSSQSLPKDYAEEVAGGGLNSPSVGITRRFGGGKTTESKVVEASGENLLLNPGSKAVTLYWIALATSEGNAEEVLAEVKLGTQTPYTWFLGKPGYFMHWEPVVGRAGDELSVHLSGAMKVAVSFTYSEG